jgi:hypothetical protein
MYVISFRFPIRRKHYSRSVYRARTQYYTGRQNCYSTAEIAFAEKFDSAKQAYLTCWFIGCMFYFLNYPKPHIQRIYIDR